MGLSGSVASKVSPWVRRVIASERHYAGRHFPRPAADRDGALDLAPALEVDGELGGDLPCPRTIARLPVPLPLMQAPPPRPPQPLIHHQLDTSRAETHTAPSLCRPSRSPDPARPGLAHLASSGHRRFRRPPRRTAALPPLRAVNGPPPTLATARHSWASGANASTCATSSDRRLGAPAPPRL